jgi:predicted PurR-regulated permease PerM
MNALKIQSYFLFVLLTVSTVLAFFIFEPFLVPLILAAIFSTTLYPIHTRILRMLGNRKGLAAFLTLLLSVVCVLAPLMFVGSKVIGQAQGTYQSLSENGGQALLQQTIIGIGNSLQGTIPSATTIAAKMAANINTYLSQGLSWVLAHAGGAFSSILGIGLDLFIFFFALFYFLKEGPALRQSLITLSPFADSDDEHILTRLSLTINSVVKGSLVVALIQGILASIGLTLFGIPNSLLWGTLAAFAALIPGVGTSLVLIPAVAYLFIIGAPLHGVGLLLWAVVAVGLVDNFLGPKIMGRGIHMHQLVVMLSVLGGLAFFGPAGIFLGPLCISLLVALFSIYSEKVKDSA